ncbi:MAG: SpoIIE family protein phosphatase [Acidobacteriota bacterium]
MTRTRKRLLFVWLIAFAAALVIGRIEAFFGKLHQSSSALPLFKFLAILIFICLTVYWISVGTRYLLRKLFWRVGRRLALSYFLIGLLPFLLFAVLLVVMGYAFGGVLSQAAYRSQRQQILTKLDQWNLEYTVNGTKPRAMENLEIYDVKAGEKTTLPSWLTGQSFSGMVIRGKQVLLVSARLYENDGDRHEVVLVQPLDEAWAKRLEAETGMIVSYSAARSVHRKAKRGGVHIQTGEGDNSFDAETLDDSMWESFFNRAWRPNGVIWGDLTRPIVEWDTGLVNDQVAFWTFIWNPWRNLVVYYFASSDYAVYVFMFLGALALSMLLVYLPATILASMLIFSISRAVNRIEKGTRAVERGDFSYRIAMKPRNQLGEMAQSFDRMTESISTLLTKVAEKERLQSEIDIAATIQRNLLPKEGPQQRGVSFSAHFEPTASIGGDYYDVFSIDKSRLAVAIGDVSGHGLSTGLVMAMVKAAITTLVEEGADETSLFRRLNELVFRSTEKRAFMTLAFTIFDLDRGTIRHTNAGHLYPYLLRSGSLPRPIESPSLPLGVRSELRARTVEVELREGDTLVYLSDGIVEAQDSDGDPFGFDQLEQILATAASSSPSEVKDAILAAIAVHAGNRPADDDRTVMVLRFDQLVPRRLEQPAEAGTADQES